MSYPWEQQQPEQPQQPEWKGRTIFDVEGFIARHLTVRQGPLEWPDRGRKWVLEVCPFNPDHIDGCAVVTQGFTGNLGFKCQHNSCADKHWPDLQQLFEPKARRNGHNRKPNATAGPPGIWRAELIVNKDGQPRPLIANAMHILRNAPELAGMVRWDSFAARPTVGRTPPWGSPEPGAQWTDQEDRKLTEWLQRDGLTVGVEIAGLAAQTVAMEYSYNPVGDYLNRHEWDGKSRLDTWLTEYLGVEPTDYTTAVGSRYLVSAVARALSEKPVKCDCILVLEGTQGIKKSTSAQTLFAPWFCDHLPDLSTKDAYLQLRGTWCVEIAELETISRATAAKVKSFLSSENDRYRPPYGKRAVDVPRRCVFIGTTNADEYLIDETGARRFWPVKTKSIKIDELGGARDQLWAEAVKRYKDHSKWWLETEDLVKEASKEQDARYDEDPWEQPIQAWLNNPFQRFSNEREPQPLEPYSSDKNSTTVSEVLLHCIGCDLDRQTQSYKNRASRCLKRLGWERYRDPDGNPRPWRYKRLS